jgi:hypothetical protein
MSGVTPSQQKKVIGWVTLIYNHRIGCESAMCRSCQDGLAVGWGQSIEKL